ELTSDEERLALLCEKLEDTFATVFRQVSMFRFERRIHEARRTEGELATERFNEMWQECMGEMFGEALTLGDAHKWTWAYIPHIIQTPFYVYAYAFGELLVLSLYARYQEQGQSFIAQYLDFLAAGGSQSPQELLGKLNIDVTDPDFWQGGCDLIRHNLKRAQELATALS
ncbi:MAG: M3 family metallopeptidase, partial [Vulcanimicrobiota bacterium]